MKVTSSSTISVKRVTYTVPSRLIGQHLLVHIYDVRNGLINLTITERLDIYFGHELTLKLDRIYAQKHFRARSVNYKHVIYSLTKKPNAFKYSQLRDDIIPEGDFTLLWKDLTKDKDCRYMVDLLLLANNYDCEKALARYVLTRYIAEIAPLLKIEAIYLDLVSPIFQRLLTNSTT